MKFLHTSDLHIGKKLNGFSLIEDQEYILNQILKIAAEENTDAIIIAGDIYDKPIPSAESVCLFDRFITKISELNIPAFIISGNHDSAERISFGSSLMKTENIYFSPVFSGEIKPVVLNDEYGKVYVYMLPFIKPAYLNHILENEKKSLTISSYDEAVNYIINNYMQVNTNNRNVIISHQFVTGAKTCESEEMSVGGTENISADNFKLFDYAALGHIHSPQYVGNDKYRYCGTPLKYSFSEAKDKKSVTLAEFKKKGNIVIREKELSPLKNMSIIEGTYSEIVSEYSNIKTEDYVKIILKDEYDIPDIIGKMRTLFPNLMNIEYSNIRNKSENSISEEKYTIEKLSEIEMLNMFYEIQNNQPLSDVQKKLAEKIFEEIQEETRL